MISMLEPRLDAPPPPVMRTASATAAHPLMDSSSIMAPVGAPAGSDTNDEGPAAAAEQEDEGLMRVLAHVASPSTGNTHETALLAAVDRAIALQRATLLMRAKREEACALAVLELTAARSHARAHIQRLEEERQEARLWQFVRSTEPRETLATYRQVQHGCSSAAEMMGHAAKALAALSKQLAEEPHTRRRLPRCVQPHSTRFSACSAVWLIRLRRRGARALRLIVSCRYHASACVKGHFHRQP